tara:strand:- start:108 stop:737 length:630 start_codon:yes stop_codon:yes gene_type:complete
MKRTKKNKKKRKNKTKKIYDKDDFSSGDGMLTSVWGPSLWHYLHTMSFNYPVKPTKQDKKNYKKFIYSLRNVLPCKYCRINLHKNLKTLPIKSTDLKNRKAFSKYMFKLHEHINKMLGKKSGLTYDKVRERYEHFRSRCTINIDKKTKLIKINNIRRKTKKKTKKNKKEKGCVEPLYGKKSKCIIKIVPKDKKVKTFQMDDACIKKRNV